ncbi:hypothetical protein A2V49_03360 [candidate division WWE3 bacterium RBG_19FT_COMBO_34_6]|uniref:Uncharacterized protein n=1 Tax=candidate division WWE3 bacterium RBG_19FT_COMBO_34_6 TaxID=1802612 RepID=A0A1F4UKE0_UNCKA|nr:MAG: hypothetical protein A2V49_03360 [candidate division WWE3 bacterium RBG_19FT_COMBO_34_6]
MIKLPLFKINSMLIKKLTPIIAILLFLGIAGFLGYNYYNTQKQLSEYKEHSDVQAIKEKYDLIKKIGKITLLPENEEPTIATVKDAYTLKEQKFFYRAENGDKVIIYAQSSRAILYRPSINKIIESAPVNIRDLQGSVATAQLAQAENTKQSTESVLGTEEQKEPAKIAVYNGTKTMQGMASKVSNFLQSKYDEKEIEIKELSNTDELFEDTVVINITKKYDNLTKNLVSLLAAKEEQIPEDDDLPDVDILIIIGADFSPDILK